MIEKKAHLRTIIIICIFIILIRLHNSYKFDFKSNQKIPIEPSQEITHNYVPKQLGKSIPQNTCAAWDLPFVMFEMQPNNETFEAHSKFNSLMWIANYFTNYTVTIDGTTIAEGVIRYDQDSLIQGRVNITKSLDDQRRHHVILNVTGLESGEHEITLKIAADPKYVCPEECNSCVVGGMAEDTVLVKIVTCIHIDYLPAIIINSPSGLIYTEGSTGNLLAWTVQFATRYNVTIDGKNARFTLRTVREHTVVYVNVDGLEVGNHTILLNVSAPWEDVCFDKTYPYYCSCGGGGGTQDTVWVNVMPKNEPSFITPGFVILVGLIAIISLVFLVYRKRVWR
ncbi:MAG: hypothetical protein ACFFCW_46650 [Candidatus Hodarchaeota archaeon]